MHKIYKIVRFNLGLALGLGLGLPLSLSLGAIHFPQLIFVVWPSICVVAVLKVSQAAMTNIGQKRYPDLRSVSTERSEIKQREEPKVPEGCLENRVQETITRVTIVFLYLNWRITWASFLTFTPSIFSSQILTRNDCEEKRGDTSGSSEKTALVPQYDSSH
ncbi:hypothetical protein WN51_14541 [Melipona quadrifasciata]|uniref:Uncharacterized protein n=1 Tax=Melipona quadrifasciata TaxID=166423 RepID=A0A0M8ZY60_9HYME|nr:hypothetical protein WN51_14541 [Melipona quadrifasciata]